jgi:hypothetical protein
MGSGLSIWGASEQSGAIKDAARYQKEAAMEALWFQERVRKQNIAAIESAVERGEISLEEGNRRASEIMAPLAGLQPLEQYQDILARGPGELTPQQSREFGRGVEALQAGFSRTSGGGISSRALERAQEYGQDFASRRMDESLNRLVPLLNIMTGARTSQANLASDLGTQQAQLRMQGASALAGIPSEGIARSMSQIGQIGAAQSINQANVYSDLMENLSGIGSQFAETWARNPQLFSGGGSGGSLDVQTTGSSPSPRAT